MKNFSPGIKRTPPPFLFDFKFLLILFFLFCYFSNSAQSIVGITNLDFNKKEVSFSAAITDTFNLHSMKIIPDNLTLAYVAADSSFSIYGGATLMLEDDKLLISAGTEQSPGILIRNNELQEVTFGITENFNLKGLAIKTVTLGFSWQSELSGDVYHLFGDVKIDLDEDEVDFSFGTEAKPGLVIDNGKITSYKIGTSDDLHFGGLEVITDDFTVEHSSGEYQVYGKLLVKELWKAIINLGDSPGSGITLKTVQNQTKFKIDKASIDLGNIDLGALEMKDLKLTIADDAISEVNADVSFPPGWEVDADLKFDANHKLNSIEIDWEAETLDDAIEIPGTGGEIMKIKGGLANFDDPHNFEFNGDVGVAFGGPFEIDGHDVAIVYIEADAKITRDELKIDASAEVGTYKDSKGWHGLLGDATIKLDFKWGNMYSFSGDINVPGGNNAIISADIDAHLSSSGAFNALAEVHLKVPKSVPLIGGHEFGDLDGAVHYDKTDSASYAAGWVDVNLVFHKFKKGVKYNFKEKDISIVGAKAITSLKASAKELPGTNPFYTEKTNVTLDSDEDLPHFMQVKITLKENIDVLYADVTSTVPYLGGYANCYFVDGIDEISEDHINFSMLEANTTKRFTNPGGEITFYILPVNYSDKKSKLEAGSYWVDLSNSKTNNLIESIEVHKIYDTPTITSYYTDVLNDQAAGGDMEAIVQNLLFNWYVEAEFYHTQNDVAHAYFSTDSINFTKIGSKNFTSENINGLKNSIEFWWPSIDDFNPGDAMYMQVSVEDGVNAPVFSEVNKIEIPFPVKGKIKLANQPDSCASGINVNIAANLVMYDGKQFGKWHHIINGNGKTTNKNGEFGFTQSIRPETEIILRVDMPFGYEWDPASDSEINKRYTVPYPDGGDVGKYDFGTIILRKKQ